MTGAPHYHSGMSGTLWPSGDITMSLIQRDPNKPRKKRSQAASLSLVASKDDLIQAVATECDRTQSDASSYQDYQEIVDNFNSEPRQVGLECSNKLYTGNAALLGLAAVQYSRKSPPDPLKWGRKGIKSPARRIIRSIAKLMGERHHRRCLSFGTLTVPPMPDANRKRLHRSWHKLVKDLMEWLQYHQRRMGLPNDLVLVSEIQGDRFTDTNQVWLHLHWLMVGRSHPLGGKWCITTQMVDEYWAKLIEKYSGVSVDCSKACTLTVTNKCPGRYISKYLSKGCGNLCEIEAAGELEYLPKKWWNAPRALVAEVKAACVKLTANQTHLIRLHLDKLKEQNLLRAKILKRDWFDGQRWREIEVGVVGYLVGRTTLSDLLEALDSFRQLEVLRGGYDPPQTYAMGA